jgi:putative intracellular protease/amidase
VKRGVPFFRRSLSLVLTMMPRTSRWRSSGSAYPACAPEVRSAGGEWVDIPVDPAHVDGKLVTAAAWPAHPQWLARYLQLLGMWIEP